MLESGAGDAAGLAGIVEVELELALKVVGVRVVVDDDVFVVEEGPGVRDIHLVDEDEGTRGESLERPEVTLPVRRVAGDDDLRGAHRAEVGVVELLATGGVDLARDALVLGVLVEEVGDPLDDSRPRRLAIDGSVGADDVEVAIGAVPRLRRVEVRVGDGVGHRVVVPPQPASSPGVGAVLLGHPRPLQVDQVRRLLDLSVEPRPVALVQDHELRRRRRRRRLFRRVRQVQHELGRGARRGRHDRRVGGEPHLDQMLEPPPRLRAVRRHQVHSRPRPELQLRRHALRDPV
mmetsp:Transcript_13948/g.44042  ORF Transcript_13948/g.44042 Transcript_13948/m.44042 type:complete len:290 (+) Transcript_13948:558-1427(+)